MTTTTTTTTLPDDLKRIENPEFLNGRQNRPEGFTKHSRSTHSYCSSGLPLEFYEDDSGHCLVVNLQIPHIPRFQVFSSVKAWEIANYQRAMRDPEATGGRFFPSDYGRLRIVRKEQQEMTGRGEYVRSDVSATGWQHAPSCDCSACGKDVSYYHAKYAHSETEGYFPFCPECFDLIFSGDVVNTRTASEV